jgi:hypothetical protein
MPINHYSNQRFRMRVDFPDSLRVHELSCDCVVLVPKEIPADDDKVKSAARSVTIRRTEIAAGKRFDSTIHELMGKRGVPGVAEILPLTLSWADLSCEWTDGVFWTSSYFRDCGVFFMETLFSARPENGFYELASLIEAVRIEIL